jgi:hypothetical protein
MSRTKKHETNAAKTAASEKMWRDAGNYQAKAWIPNTPTARQKLKEFSAQLRRDEGTVVSKLFS